MSSKTDRPDFSGCVVGEHPEAGDGWIKGWLPRLGEGLVAVVCAHSNPAVVPPNNIVACVGNGGRKIVRSVVRVQKVPALHKQTKAFREQKSFGDIALIRVDKPFPPGIARYDWANPSGRIWNRNRLGEVRSFKLDDLLVSSDIPWLAGSRDEPSRFAAGDSGTPWFVKVRGMWCVTSHTARGYWGEGPWYAHSQLSEILKQSIKNLLK